MTSRKRLHHFLLAFAPGKSVDAESARQAAEELLSQDAGYSLRKFREYAEKWGYSPWQLDEMVDRLRAAGLPEGRSAPAE